MRRLIVTFGVVLVTASQLTYAQARVDNNVVYGMYSGLGLLMDVYRPSADRRVVDRQATLRHHLLQVPISE